MSTSGLVSERGLQARMSVAQRVQAVEAMLVAGADAEDASVVATGTPLTSWLQLAGNLERREASGIVCTGKELAAYPCGAGCGGGREGVGTPGPRDRAHREPAARGARRRATR